MSNQVAKEITNKQYDGESEKDLGVSALSLIKIKDPEFYGVLEETILQIADTYGDKYEAVDNKFLKSREVLFHKDHGLGACLHNNLKYIQRFTTVGFGKSRNPKDIIKGIHYLLFMLVWFKRNSNLGETK